MTLTVQQAIVDSTAGNAALERLDAQLLLLHTLGRPLHDRAWLIAHDSDAIGAAHMARFQHLCQRRSAGEPLAYLVGEREFFGLTLHVDARVLVPRPDTETLVEWALELAALLARPRVLDLGTGSGAIALALQHARPDAEVHALDASADALAVARGNAERLDLPVRFHQGSWLRGHAGHYDLIVSNPPYIASQDPHLAALVHEPLQALASGSDGLDDLRDIVAQAPAHLRPDGWLLLEHGWDQAEAVQTLLQDSGFANIESRADLAGILRCTGGRWRAVK